VSRTPSFEDLTARARIREAALDQFAENGFERTTIRGIAAAAGVSPGLVRHHFGSKQELHEAVDQYVLDEIRRVNNELMVEGVRGTFSVTAASREAMQPFQRYLSRSIVDGSKTIATLFDQMVDLTEGWVGLADEAIPDDPPFSDRRTRAAVFTAMVLGVSLLHEHLTRVLGVDLFAPEGDRQLTEAMLDIYSRALLSRELAASARATLYPPSVQRSST
jgi:AcrR family transcriptional regulator